MSISYRNNLHSEIFFCKTILQKFNNGKLDSNEYSDKIPTGIQHSFKIVVVQPIKPTQMFYKKEDDGYDTSTATITLGLVRTGISTHVYD